MFNEVWQSFLPVSYTSLCSRGGSVFPRTTTMYAYVANRVLFPRNFWSPLHRKFIMCEFSNLNLFLMWQISYRKIYCFFLIFAPLILHYRNIFITGITKALTFVHRSPIKSNDTLQPRHLHTSLLIHLSIFRQRYRTKITYFTTWWDVE